MTTKDSLSLDVSHPTDVASILRNAAEAYCASAIELESAWQDPTAGRPWNKIAAILERTATQIEGKIKCP